MKRNKKSNLIKVKTVDELADALGLTRADAEEIELHCQLNNKIIETAKKSCLTHAQIAKLAHTSRTRLTAILNRNTHAVSTDLLLRILTSLGVKTKISFSNAA